MAGRPRDYVLTEPGGQQLAQVRAALATGFTVTGGQRPARERRTWLDTFDWRLYRAGLTLQQVATGNSAELMLTGPDGNQVTAALDRTRRTPRASRRPRTPQTPGTSRWPVLASALPAGVLRDRLVPLTGNRALLPVATATSQTSELRLLNEDRKTVARLGIEALTLAAPPARGQNPASQASIPLPSRLTVGEVRGYQAAARRARRLVAGTAGVTVSRRTALDAALAAAGRRALDYNGKVDVKLRPAMPGREAVSALLLQQLDTLEANVDGVLRDIDTEFLHDLRIAVRRTRTALKLLGDQLPGELTLRFASEFRWLGDLTTPLRDLDVQLEELPSTAARLVAAQPADLEPFRIYLVQRRATERRALNRGLRSARFAAVLGDWRKALLVPKANRRGPAGPKAGDLAADRTRRAYNKVIRMGAAITDDSPAESLHTLRKRCKELRYVLEFFGALHDPQAQRAMVSDLKRLQDCLGEFQDSEVQQFEIQALATAMLDKQATPAPTLLAMGEVAGQLGLRQQRARAEFAGRFTEFAGNGGRRRLAALTPSTRAPSSRAPSTQVPSTRAPAPKAATLRARP
ncbi:MAG TPA: CHAD domain-containing protein [Streptosporangiaceae bacterium]|nr:CHAD domain-containing protein [Streptosporangiaceae bacterium]